MKIITEPYQLLIDFLRTNGSKVENGNDTWYYCPYWFHEDGDKLVMIGFESLPKELIEVIQKHREGL